MGQRYESVRNFIILHDKPSKRNDSKFWRHGADLAIPERLLYLIVMCRESARKALHEPDGYGATSMFPCRLVRLSCPAATISVSSKSTWQRGAASSHGCGAPSCKRSLPCPSTAIASCITLPPGRYGKIPAYEQAESRL